MSNGLHSSACEVDVPRRGRHACARLASETPSALLDWNNNYGDDPNKAVCFHCSNLPKHFFEDVRMDYPGDHRGHGREAEHLRDLVASEGIADELRPLLDRRSDGQDPRLCRQGAFTDDPLQTFGGAGVVEIPGCRNCCTTSARTASSTTSQRTSRPSRLQYMRRRCDTWVGRCTGTRISVQLFESCSLLSNLPLLVQAELGNPFLDVMDMRESLRILSNVVTSSICRSDFPIRAHSSFETITSSAVARKRWRPCHSTACRGRNSSSLNGLRLRKMSSIFQPVTIYQRR